MRLKEIFIFLTIFHFTVSVLIQVDEKITNCIKEEERANAFDISQVHLIAENDTHTFLNGSIKWLLDVKQPWKCHVYSEKFIRDTWQVHTFDRTYQDFCNAIKSPLEPFYHGTKHLKCPMKKGDLWEWDMFNFNMPQAFLDRVPNHFVGRWRMSIVCDYKVKSAIKQGCLRAFSTIFD